MALFRRNTEPDHLASEKYGTVFNDGIGPKLVHERLTTVTQATTVHTVRKLPASVKEARTPDAVIDHLSQLTDLPAFMGAFISGDCWREAPDFLEKVNSLKSEPRDDGKAADSTNAGLSDNEARAALIINGVEHQMQSARRLESSEADFSVPVIDRVDEIGAVKIAQDTLRAAGRGLISVTAVYADSLSDFSRLRIAWEK